MKVRLITLALLLAVGAHGAFAQSLDAGLAAEADGRWADAIRVYQAAIEQQPARPDLWMRIADIEAARSSAPRKLGLRTPRSTSGCRKPTRLPASLLLR
jgi:hypothetical protein